MRRGAVWLRRAIERLLGKRRATVVVYHSINDPPIDTPSARLRSPARLGFRRDHLAIIRLRDLPSALNDHRLKVAITFDDALAGFQQNTYQVLRELQVPATVFVPTGLIGRSNEWDDDTRRPTLPIMTGDQILALARDGLIDFGSRSILARPSSGASHVHLARETEW
jgi:hypothetical protein